LTAFAASPATGPTSTATPESSDHPNGRRTGKLIRCGRGRIFDVAADLRKGSPTYAKWVGLELSEENQGMLWVPRGFAHGFCVLSDIADVLYKTTDYYSPNHDRSILWSDPDIGIVWPIAEPQVSPRDAKAPRLRDAENNFVYQR
jgi:dTDP-4-dehydrorhamnose 3,5-epimerase